MDNLTVKHVDVFGDDIVAAQDANGNIWAGASYFCRAFGMNKNEKDRQIKNIQSDEVLNRGCVKFDAGVFDQGNPTLALLLDYVPLWLAKISITPSMKGNNPGLVEKLVNYQLKAKDVLADAFLTPYKMEIPKDYPTALRAYADEIERRQIAEQKIESLNTENNLLAEKTLEWADRSLINALVRAYGHSMDDDYGRAWRDFKKELLYRHSININSRITKQLNETGKRPKTLSVLDDSELSRALSTATALCRDNDVDISDILKKKDKQE